jgi:hypothetical protein
MSGGIDLRARYAAGELTTDVPTAGAALGLGRGTAYAAARAQELPGCLRIRGRFVVSIPALLRALSALDEPQEATRE